jgi:hypothetical protein
MSTRIREVRVSFIWFERWGDIWSSANPISMEFLRSPAAYSQEFGQMIEETVKALADGKEVPAARLEATGLTPPWPFKNLKYPQWFWVFYLGGKRPEQVDGASALRMVVPFRTGFPATIRAQRKAVALITDGFIYPHGIGLVLALRLFFDRAVWPKEGVQTSVAMRMALAASKEDLYNVAWNGTTQNSENLSSLADSLLNHLRGRVLGPGMTAAARTQIPFSVASVVRGDTDSIDNLPQENGDIHHLLNGLCTFSKSWDDDTPDLFRLALLRIRHRAPNGHLLYHTSRGRAVWFPASFTKTGTFNRAAGCFHRNLTMLHLETEALIEALTTRRDLLSKGAKLPDLLEQLATDAAEHLSTLYSSSDETYQSSSARTFLDETPSHKKLVNDTLTSYKKDTLKYEAWPH